MTNTLGKKDLLIEVGTEDLPARLLPALVDELARLLAQQLNHAGLAFSGSESFCTPRRLAVIFNDLDACQQDRVIERKGPSKSAAFDATGTPTKAVLGFARSCGVDVSQLECIQIAGEPKIVFREKRKGASTSELIPGMLEAAMRALTLPKRMRWNATGVEFIRPVRWLLLLFGYDAIAARVLGQVGANTTCGHRFHNPARIVIDRPSEYRAQLYNHHVIASFAERREVILAQVEKLADSVPARPAYSQALLDEITNLVEWPQALLGEFDKKFLCIPKEVLISTMQDNQKYIPLFNSNDKLLASFILVSNLESTAPDTIRRGNEKVIAPRFEDAAFFWQRDQSLPLMAHLEKLKGVVYERQLGSLYDKTTRITALVGYLSPFINADPSLCTHAARLCKCDLLTAMVGEFPKLQGIIGRYLALNENQDEALAQALEEQYLPRQAGGALPLTAGGQTLALSDRLDTLVGIFAIGKKPTGVKDPYGLRRAALGVLRIMIEARLDIDLHASLQQAAALFEPKVKARAVVDEVFDYCIERLRTYFLERDVAGDVIDAVLSKGLTQPHDMAMRIDAVSSFRECSDALSLAAANKRIRNILKKNRPDDTSTVDAGLFKQVEETALHTAIGHLSAEVEGLLQQREYAQALLKLATLRQPVDAFFDNVMVMHEDAALKTNRIALLAEIDGLFMRVADFSRLQT